MGSLPFALRCCVLLVFNLLVYLGTQMSFIIALGKPEVVQACVCAGGCARAAGAAAGRNLLAELLGCVLELACGGRC